MSPRRKNNLSNKKHASTRSRNRKIIVRGVQRPEPDYAKLSRAVLELAKDMQRAADLGITVEELRRERWSSEDGD